MTEQASETRDCGMCGVNHGYGMEDNKACLQRQLDREAAKKADA